MKQTQIQIIQSKYKYDITEIEILHLINLDPFFKRYPGLKKDKEFLLFAVEKNIFFLEFLKFLNYSSEDLPRYKKAVLAAVKKNGLALEHASDLLKADKEVVLAAVKKDGLALKHASDLLKADKEVVLAAVEQNVSALEYADT